jgi:hypothetical protein
MAHLISVILIFGLTAAFACASPVKVSISELLPVLISPTPRLPKDAVLMKFLRFVVSPLVSFFFIGERLFILVKD